MKLTRFLGLTFIAIIAISWFCHSSLRKKTKALYLPKKQTGYITTDKTIKKLEQKVAEVKQLVRRNGYNENICFLVDMTLPSGQNRFFIYDLKKDTVQGAGLVAHGNCYQYWLEGRKYSNVVGSGCTSLGKYRIGPHYNGRFGYSFKLIGLDSSNNNAFERTVVLHSHSCIPETEVAEDICQSNGCPMVSPNFLEHLKKIINSSKKPVMLWIYE
ncbi:MAG TPA: murein L,D-transpeptidase catalytic domain family protein [Chitinophagaceae bacterium]